MRYTPVFFALLLSLNAPAWSADSTPSVSAKVDAAMDSARSLIAKKDWPAALVVLQSYTQSNASSADGFNLLGYSYRNLNRYPESLVAYKQALKLDPKHLGAHEYIGMAYLNMGQLADAKIHLDALDKICIFGCEEYSDLKKSYEAALKVASAK